MDSYRPNGYDKSESPYKFEMDFEDEPENTNRTNNHEKNNREESQYMNSSKGLPVQIVRFNEKSKRFEFNEDAQQVFFNYDGPISFVSLAGQYRTGKSFLLNKLLDLTGDGFRVDPSVTACTEGIWMWTKPIYDKTKKQFIFFLDTEGTNSTNRERNHDAKIFALSILLSSVFLFNSVGSIDEQSINQLNLTTSLSKNLMLAKNENGSISDFTPKFLWILRDFVLELEDYNHKKINPTQYLENALNDKTAISKSNDSNRKIRRALLDFFRDRDCFPLVRPVIDEDDLRNLSKLPPYKIRKEFTNQVKLLKDRIIQICEPKSLNTKILEGKHFIPLLKSFIESINEGNLPNIGSAWEHLAERENEGKFEESVGIYERELGGVLKNDEPMRVTELIGGLNKCRENSMQNYLGKTYKRDKDSSFKIFLDRLKEGMEKRENQVLKINEEISEAYDKEIIQKLSEEIKINLNGSRYSSENLEDFNSHISDFFDNYDKGSLGMKKSTVFIDFLKDFLPHSINSINNASKRNNEVNEFQEGNEEEVFKEKEDDYRSRIDAMKQKLQIYKDKEKRSINQIKKIKENPAKTRYETLKSEVENLNNAIIQKSKNLKAKDDNHKKLQNDLKELKEEEKRRNKSIWCCGGAASKKPRRSNSNIIPPPPRPQNRNQ